MRQELARGSRRSGELLSQRAPAAHGSAHAHEDAALVAKVAPVPQSYNYRSPCFRDLQTQNAYLRGQVAKMGEESRGDASEIEFYKGQVHELTVHRAVLHKENERLLAEREAVEDAARRNAATHDKHIELTEQGARLRVQLEDSLALNDSLRAELRAAALARAAEQVRARALEQEVASMEAELKSGASRHRLLREEAAGTEHQLKQAHLLLSKTQEVRALPARAPPTVGAAAHRPDPPSAVPLAAQSHASARAKLDELAAQHDSMKATFRAQSALGESLDLQLRRARADMRGHAGAHEEASVALAQERERHVGTQHALAAAQLEVERLQQKLEWCAQPRQTKRARPRRGPRHALTPSSLPKPTAAAPRARRLSERYGADNDPNGGSALKLRDAHEQIAALQARMALYSQWVGVSGQDAVRMRQWSKHDAKLRGHLHHERDQRDKAWVRASDLRAGY